MSKEVAKSEVKDISTTAVENYKNIQPENSMTSQDASNYWKNEFNNLSYDQWSIPDHMDNATETVDSNRSAETDDSLSNKASEQFDVDNGLDRDNLTDTSQDTNQEIGINKEILNNEVLSDVELFKSVEDRRDLALRGDGVWLGEPGQSGFIPNNKEAKQIMEKYGVESIKYDRNYEPDFRPVSEGTVEIDNMSQDRLGPGKNYEQAFEKLSEQWNSNAREGRTDWTSRDVEAWADSNNLSPHERMDKKTVDFVPRIINKECKHIGGCSECKARDNIGGGFDA